MTFLIIWTNGKKSHVINVNNLRMLLFPFWIFNMSNMTAATSGAGTAYLSGTP